MCFSFYLKLAVIVVALVIQMNEVVCEDHLALLAIKSKITDDSEGLLRSWNDSLPFCQWRGVTCGRRHQRVTSLDIANWGLVGTLSPYIGNLSFLRYIYFEHNQLHGSIPPEIGRLFRLRVLSLANNSFTEEIPINISSCTKLLHLGLTSNMLSGNIPNIFSSLGMIQTLYFAQNKLTGGIPPSIGNLTSLQKLALSGCPLGGSIPDSFSQLKNLQKIGLGEMGLVGVFPPFLFNLSKLQLLNFPENQLVGRLPSNLCLSQPHLQILEFSFNNFSGFLPPSISNCSELQNFDVFGNDFKGEIATDFGKLLYLNRLNLGRTDFGTEVLGGMKHFDSLSNCSNLEVLVIIGIQIRRGLPDSLGNLTKLTYLYLQSNYISGSLPSSIGNLFSLNILSLFGNNFTGMIPESIGNLRNLGVLDLGLNSFSGIPRSIGNMSSLTKFSLSSNKLEGSIPSSIGACKVLLQVSLAQNNLTGSIPKELFQLSSLSIRLDLSQNNLSGVLPQEIGHLKNLGVIDLSENNLSGELPGTFGSCISLQTLNLSCNLFNGSMPETLSSLKGLEYVNLSQNKFSGSIPINVQQIALKYLDLSYNDFEGEVPVKGAFSNTSAISVIGNHRLCGGIPELHLPRCKISNHPTSKKLSLGVILAISLSSTIASLALMSFLLFHCCKKKKTEIPLQSVSESFEKISYGRLCKATEGFSSEHLIGTGSFASVYKGVVDENGPTVAIKVLNLQRRGGSKSFIAECEALRHIRHRNLVKVITICSSLDFKGNDFKALVYDFMPNGNLESWLHPCTTRHDLPHEQLDLFQRISIAKDVACALDYLHYRCGNVVVHCDLKPSNILLDADMVAHVGDFGLAKILSFEQLSHAHKSSSSSLMRGTVGYAPPEYGVGNEVSASGDIYSYGILLLEMLTGKKPINPLFEQGLNLHSYARTALTDGSVLQIVDPVLLNDSVKERCLISLVKIGVNCSSESPQDRLNIGTIIHELSSLIVTASSSSTA